MRHDDLWSSGASVRDLERQRKFLHPKSPSEANRAGDVLLKGVQALSAHSKVGRPIDDLPNLYRTWQIDFDDSGYITRYGVDGVF